MTEEDKAYFENLIARLEAGTPYFDGHASDTTEALMFEVAGVLRMIIDKETKCKSNF